MAKYSHGRTSTCLVVRACLPANRGSLSHVAQSIDEYLTLFLRHEVFTAACEQGISEHTLDLLLQYIAPAWKEVVHAAVRGGHLNVLRWMTEREDGPWKADFDDMLQIAATHGHLDIVKWLYGRGIDWHALWEMKESTPEYVEKTRLYKHCSSEALKEAAEHEHFDVVQWIYITRTDTCTTYCKPIDRAVANGHLTIAKWLYDVDGESYSSRAVDEAAENRHLEMLHWLDSSRLLTCSTSAIDSAARNGHLEVVQWLRTHHVRCTARALHLAANNGHLEVVKWIYENINNDFRCYEAGWSATAISSNGDLEMLRWAHEHFPHKFSSITMDAAAENGHFDVVMWLHEHRNEGCTVMAPFDAASGGHLNIVKWLHVHYTNKFVPQVMDGAAGNGHLEVVRWLHENRREDHRTEAIESAARSGHLDVVLFLLEHRNEGFSMDAMVATQDIELRCFFGSSDNHRPNDSFGGVRSDNLSLLQAAFSRKPAFVQGCLRCLAEIAVGEGNVEMLDWLNHFGLELRLTTPIRNAVSRGDVTLLQWFHQNGFEVREPDLLELAVLKDRLDVARWLSKHGYSICSLKLVEAAGRNKNVPLLRWLVERGPPLNFSVVRKLVMESRHVEIAPWVSEPDQVQLVLEALQKEDQEVIWWILTRTHFQDERSQRSICDEIQRGPHDVLVWLQESLVNFEKCKWYFM